MLHYAITDGRLSQGVTAKAADAWLSHYAAVARGDVEFLMVREKALGAGELAELCRRLMAAVRNSGTQVLIAGRPDVALVAGADGVHLSGGVGELRVGQAKAVCPRSVVSVSCHTLDEVRAAREDGASMVLFGPVFGKTVDGVEVAAGVGLERLREACREAEDVSVFAIGGVNADNERACVEAGAAGVAGIRMFAAQQPVG